MISKYKILLGSGSPRRKQMLEDLGISFTISKKEVEETYPENLEKEKVAEYLSVKKGEAFSESLKEDELVITADTTVVVGNVILGKAKGAIEAKEMLRTLSGKEHYVYTGVCLKTKAKTRSFTSSTKVYFKELSEEEIDYYIKEYQPFDKAGAYGIQEWIGMIGIEKIEGSYFNVVGLPVQRLYSELLKY